MLEKDARNCSFVLIGNIPSALRSSDLRAFFSHLVEKRGFACFHFRHRPEHVAPRRLPDTSATSSDTVATSGGVSPQEDVLEGTQPSEASTAAADGEESGGGRGGDGTVAASTRCCVAALERRMEAELLRRYRGRHWAKPGGEMLRRKVQIGRLSISYNEEAGTWPGSSGLAAENGPLNITTQSGIPWSDLASLPELNPPSVMPQGNVGTPTSVFMDLIQQCKLPGRLIKKLSLEFPKMRSRRRYGAVGLDYGGEVTAGGGEDDEAAELGRHEKSGRERNSEEEEEEEETGLEERIPSDDDHDAEEWERYEAFHDDVDKQGRTKERLFEDEMEVVWEKGGSGLVFYTDASYWHDMDGDFDEQCSKEDDWDVDMSLYYDRVSGDKGARDLRDIRQEGRIRDGAEQASVFGGFERYTKGIGSKVLKRSGWREGRGVGRSSEGRQEPVDTDGQHPHNKTGLGYRGEQLVRHAPQTQKRHRRATRDVIISTVYDECDEEESTVMRTAPSHTIKYRQEVKFVAGGTLKPTVNGPS